MSVLKPLAWGAVLGFNIAVINEAFMSATANHTVDVPRVERQSDGTFKPVTDHYSGNGDVYVRYMPGQTLVNPTPSELEKFKNSPVNPKVSFSSASHPVANLVVGAIIGGCCALGGSGFGYRVKEEEIEEKPIKKP